MASLSPAKPWTTSRFPQLLKFETTPFSSCWVSFLRKTMSHVMIIDQPNKHGTWHIITYCLGNSSDRSERPTAFRKGIYVVLVKYSRLFMVFRRKNNIDFVYIYRERENMYIYIEYVYIYRICIYRICIYRICIYRICIYI